MHFGFTDEQEELRGVARSFLEANSGSLRVREVMETNAGFDQQLWSRISGELGWTSLIIPEAYGGSGFTFVEMIAVLEEMGRALACVPFVSSAVLASSVIMMAATETQKKEYLPAIAMGESIATVALAEASGRWDAQSIATSARPDGADYVLSGTKMFVTDGTMSDVIIVAARMADATDVAGGEPESGIGLFAVPVETPGLERTGLSMMDQTRAQAEVNLSDVRVPESARLGLGEQSTAWPAIAKVLDLTAVALAAEAVGGAQKCLDMSVAYAKEREQFGRPIGSFQAIKHKCADMLVLVEAARSATYYAAWSAAQDNDELPVVAPLAKAYAADAYTRCAQENIQIHGGIGFTWEHDAHLYLKRAKSTEVLLGDSNYHRDLLADRVGM